MPLEKQELEECTFVLKFCIDVFWGLLWLVFKFSIDDLHLHSLQVFYVSHTIKYMLCISFYVSHSNIVLPKASQYVGSSYDGNLSGHPNVLLCILDLKTLI